MPRNVWIMDVLDSVLDALFRVVVGQGDLKPSLRALAADAGMSPAGVVHHCGSRQNAVRMAAQRWVEQRTTELPRCRHVERLVDLLPTREDQVHDAVFDFALVAMARGDEGIADLMSRFRHARRQRVREAVSGLDEAGVDLVLAVVEGLLFAVAQPSAALRPEHAREALERLVTLLDGAPDAAEAPTPDAAPAPARIPAPVLRPAPTPAPKPVGESGDSPDGVTSAS